MIIYVAQREYNYGEWEIVGVYTTYELAIEAIEKNKNRFPDDRGQGTIVDEFEVDI